MVGSAQARQGAAGGGTEAEGDGEIGRGADAGEGWPLVSFYEGRAWPVTAGPSTDWPGTVVAFFLGVWEKKYIFVFKW